jgi:omega-6 fatty acid desaturase (delta-12 desaturase)
LTPQPANSTEASLRHLVAPFARPIKRRALIQLLNTTVPFVALWTLMAQSVLRDWSYLWTLLLAVPVAGLYIRLFIIQHDCGHGSFFAHRRLDHAVGAAIGVATLFPFGYWKKTHAIHHATSGNLDRRELGDVATLTVREYRALPRRKRFGYRLYRSAPVLFLFGPIYQFLIKHRFPFDIPFSWKKEWASVLWNNLAIVVVGGALSYLMGWRTVLLVHVPIVVLAGAAGIWLFYVQHQFEHAYWERQEKWSADEAAIQGSSFYDLPRWLHWWTGNIGFHHIHHLASKVPNYRLRECFESSALLQRAPRLRFWESFRCARLKLWDEEARRLVPFARLRTAAA